MFEASSLQLMYDLQTSFPDYFREGSEVEPPILLYEPNDYANMGTATSSLDLINAKGAWAITKGDPSIIIGISDTHIDLFHEDLSAQITSVRGSNLNYDGHGSQVCGSAAAATDNGVGISGIGFNSKIHFTDKWANDNELLVMSQLGAKVLNANWINGCSPNRYSQGVYNEIRDNGAIVRAGACNKNVNCYGDRWRYVYPASYDNVISVSSVGHINPVGYIDPIYGPNNWKDVHEDVPGDTTSSHVHNDKVDIVAPGYNVLTTDAGGGYTGVWGTSFASPTVAGVCALVLSVNPCLGPDDVEYIIKTTAANIYSIPVNQKWIGRLGAGRLDAEAAVKLARDYYDDYTYVDLDELEFWDTPKRISGILTIKNSETLTITSNILFANASKIIVKIGGKLILNGGSLSSGCMWEGIEIEGKNGNSQSSTSHGIVEIIGRGKIENARTGIKSFNGGIVKVNEAIFKNNRYSISFQPYKRIFGQTKNISFVTNSEFLSTKPMVDLRYTDNGAREGIKHFISINEQDAILINNNLFQTTVASVPFRPDLNGVGINSWASKTIITNNTFKGLTYGIESNGNQNVTKYNTIKGNTFDSVSLSISETGISGSQITENIFVLPEYYASPWFREHYGIKSDASRAFLISNNTFKVLPTANNKNTYGLIIKNSGGLPCSILKNTFTNIEFANQLEGDNPVIAIQCNNYIDSYLDWSINPQTVGIIHDFGQSGLTGSRVANIFRFFGFVPISDRNIRLNGQMAFKYNTVEVPYVTIPYQVSPGVDVTNFYQERIEQECEQPLDPCNGNPSTCITYIEDKLRAPSEYSEDDLTKYKIRLLQLYSDSGMYPQMNELANNNTDARWDSIKVPLFLDQGLLTDAQNVLNRISPNDYTLFMQTLIDMQQDSINILDIESSIYWDNIALIAAVGKEDVAHIAKSIVRNLYPSKYPLNAERWDDTTQNGNRIANEVKPPNKLDPGKTKPTISLVPNPNNGEFTIMVKNASNDKIEILDAKGKIIKTINLDSQGEVKIEKGLLSNGVYMVRLVNTALGYYVTEKLLIVE